MLAAILAACGREAQPRANEPAATAAPAVQAAATPLAQATPAASASPAIERTLGDPQAPIQVIEYGDYQCPFCGAFVRDTKPLIEEQYIKTGKVYIEYRDFPLVDIHPGALLAAHVANCAAEQGSFWPMHDRLYQGASARAWGQGGAADFSTFLGYATDLHLDVPALQQCVETNRHASTIETDFAEGAQRGVRSTPTFMINGKLLVGAQPFDTWRRILDDLLQQQ